MDEKYGGDSILSDMALPAVDTNPSRLTRTTKLAYGVGHVLNDLCASMWFSYTLLYMHKVASLNTVNAGLLILIGQIADALATPFVGLQSDRSSSVKYGRRKSWHLLGVICVAITFPFIFHLCINCEDAEQNLLLLYYAPFIVIFQFGWASTQISHLALIPELTVCQQGKVELNAIRYFATVMANLVVFAVCFVLFVAHSNPANGQGAENLLSSADQEKFFILAISVVALGLVFMIIFHVFVKEVPRRTDTINDEEKECLIPQKPKFVQNKVKDWFTTKAFYQVGWLYMMTRLIVNVSQIYLAYYVTETLKLHKSAIAIAPAVVYIFGIIASVLANKLNAKLGLKFTYCFGLCLVGASSVYFYFLTDLDGQYRQAVYGATALLGMGGSTLLINSLAMISEMIGKNTDTSAFVYGSMSLLDKFSNGAAVMVIQTLHPCQNKIIGCDLGHYYTDIMSYVPGACAILALLVLLTIRKNDFSDDKAVNVNYGSSDKDPINNKDYGESSTECDHLRDQLKPVV